MPFTRIENGKYLRSVQDGKGSGLFVATKAACVYTLVAEDDIVFCNATGSNCTINVPAAANLPGKIFEIKKTDNTVNTVSIVAAAMLDPVITVLSGQFDSMKIISDGTNWHGLNGLARDRKEFIIITTSETLRSGIDIYLIDATAGALVETLPAAAISKGQVFDIKKIDSSANTVTIDANAAELIDGVATKVISNQYDSYTLLCDGDGWYII